MLKRALPVLALAVSLASTNMTAHAQAKGDQALLDALVRKGVLSEKAAEDITAETAKEAVSTSAAKIQVGDWVQELKIGGDLRLRFQADQRTPMILTNPLLGAQDRNINRTRNVPGFPSNQQFPIARDRYDMVFQANLLMKF